MTKKQILDQLMLLSALESWAMAQAARMPDYLSDQIIACTEVLVAEVLGETK